MPVKRSPQKTSTARARSVPGATRAHRPLTAVERAAFLADGNAGFAARKNTPIKARGLTARAAPPAQLIAVAEGDSWFDYMPSYLSLGKDLLGHLQATGRINVYRVSQAGDTIENMVYGTDYDAADFTPKPGQLEKTLQAVRDLNPDLFLFSGGGNDLAGTELESYLNHAHAGAPALRTDHVNTVFHDALRPAILHLIAEIRKIRPTLPIFLHGYDLAVPDGRGVKLARWNFAGPWLRPAFTKKRHLDAQVRQMIVTELLTRLGAMLQEIAASQPYVHYINVTGTLRAGTDYKKDWANELHPTSSGFKKVAAVFEDAILKVVHP